MAHLRTAEVAREWERGRLLSTLQVWQRHLREQAKTMDPTLSGPALDKAVQVSTADLVFGGSGIPAPYPATLEEGVVATLAAYAEDLQAATLYVMAPSMCDVVIAAAQTLSMDDIGLIDHDDLPSPAGMLLLPHPVLVRAPTGDLGDDRGFAWSSRPVRGPDGASGPGVRISSYLDAHGPVRPDSFRDMAALAAANRTPLPPLIPDAIRTLPFRFQVPEDMRAQMREAMTAHAGHARAQGDRLRALNADLGFDEGDVIAEEFEYRPGDEITDADNLFTVRFLYAFWRLCAQDIATMEEAPVGHNARLLAERAGVDPEVRVVTIRPTRARTDEQTAATARDWHHRWVVRMHKVRQWYPSEQRHKIIYRGPYIKGPDDKPLLGGDVVRAMTPTRTTPARPR